MSVVITNKKRQIPGEKYFIIERDMSEWSRAYSFGNEGPKPVDGNTGKIKVFRLKREEILWSQLSSYHTYHTGHLAAWRTLFHDTVRRRRQT